MLNRCFQEKTSLALCYWQFCLPDIPLTLKSGQWMLWISPWRVLLTQRHLPEKKVTVCVCVCYNRLSQCQSASPTLIIMTLMVHADSIHFLHLFWQITGARNSPVRMQKCSCTTRQLACCYFTQYTLSQSLSSLFCLACASVAPPKAVKVLPLPPHPLACNAQCLHQKGKYYTDEIPWWSFSAENK